MDPNGRSAGCRIHRIVYRSALLSGFILVLLSAANAVAAWDHVRGDATGSGLANVPTAPALRPSATVPELGSFAPGANPVTGPDGTVYLGNEQGELIALHADGTPYWRRRLGPPSQSILASPVVDIDGSIYVLGVRSYTDHRVRPAARRSETRLYRFLPGGGLQWTALFPRLYPTVPALADNGASTASPTIWRHDADAAVLIPVVYRGLASKDVHLLAFSLGGGLMADKLVGAVVPATFGGGNVPGYWAVGCGLTIVGCLVPPVTFCPGVATAPDAADALPSGIGASLPPVALFTFQGGGTPWIIATDQARSLVGWTFSPASGFIENFRRSWSGLQSLSAPMVMPDAHSVVGTAEMRYDNDCGFRGIGGHLAFAGPNAIALSDASVVNGTRAAPARTADGRIVVVHDFGFDVFRGSTRLQRISFPGQSIAPAAVSRTHIYISTAGSMRTYDINTLAQVGEVQWFGGGRSGPAIGADGRIYALASNVLFIWPGPGRPAPLHLPAPRAGMIFDAR